MEDGYTNPVVSDDQAEDPLKKNEPKDGWIFDSRHFSKEQRDYIIKLMKESGVKFMEVS